MLLRKGIVEDQRVNIFFGFFILLCGLYVCPFMLGYAGWYGMDGYREFLFFVPFQQLFLIGPVLYFYTRSLLNQSLKISYCDLVHFIPSALYLLYSCVIFIFDVFIFEDFYFYADGRDKDLDLWYQIAGSISMLFYLGLCLRKYRNYRDYIEQEVSYAEEVLYSWIRNFLLAFALILVLRLMFFAINPEWAQFGRKYWYYLSFSAIGMYLTIAGYSNSLKLKIGMSPSLPQNIDQNKTSYKIGGKNTIDTIENLEHWKEQIEKLMEIDRIHTNPQLTLNDLALRLDTNRNSVSAVINDGFNMNFNDYINSKRIESVIKSFKNNQHLEKTLLGIALESGFNSKSTFNRSFKKYTSLTPKRYIEKNIGENGVK